MKIFSFPYAYGSSSIFYQLKNELKGQHNLYSFDYPAHGSRLSESALNTIESLADDALEQIKKYCAQPYCLLGYSLGGIVTFELYKKIQKLNFNHPEHIFMLGTKEPSWKYDKVDYEHCTLNEIKDILRERNGTIEEILAEDELIEMLSPAIIGDSIALRDYYAVHDFSQKTECGVTVIRGCRELNTENCQSEWEKYLNRKINYITVEGDHFFLFKEGDKMVSEICSVIKSELKSKDI